MLTDKSRDWDDWLAQTRKAYLQFQCPPDCKEGIDLAEVVKLMRGRLPDDAVVTNGAGNYTVWLHRFFRYRQPKTQLAPTSGAMGYAVPAAIAAKLAEPARPVVSVNGDGCFMMCGQELATAAQYETPVVFIVINNGMLGTIRMHQERMFPNRKIATDLANPDFVILAKSYGFEAARVSRLEDFDFVFDRALASQKSFLIELMVRPETLTPDQTITEARNFASKRI